MTDLTNPSEAALSAVRHWYGIKGAETSQAGEEEAYNLGLLTPTGEGGYTVTARAANHLPDMSELDLTAIAVDVGTSDLDFPDRGNAPTLTAGQLHKWFARFPPGTPVMVAGPDADETWLNITACFGDPEQLVLSTADDFDPRQF